MSKSAAPPPQVSGVDTAFDGPIVRPHDPRARGELLRTRRDQRQGPVSALAEGSRDPHPATSSQTLTMTLERSQKAPRAAAHSLPVEARVDRRFEVRPAPPRGRGFCGSIISARLRALSASSNRALHHHQRDAGRTRPASIGISTPARSNARSASVDPTGVQQDRTIQTNALTFAGSSAACVGTRPTRRETVRFAKAPCLWFRRQRPSSGSSATAARHAGASGVVTAGRWADRGAGDFRRCPIATEGRLERGLIPSTGADRRRT